MRKSFFILMLCFTICSAYAQPANDTYFNAQVITLNTGGTCTTLSSGTTVNATTEFPPACSGATSPPADVWYKFTTGTNPTPVVIKLTGVSLASGTNNSMYMQLLRGSNTNSVLCISGTEMSLDGSELSRTLLASTTYYLRIYNAEASSACTFNLCSSIAPPPVNNDCSGAITLPVNSGSNELKVSASNVGASASTASFACPNGVNTYDVWFKFVAPSTGNASIAFSNVRTVVGSGGASPYWAIYSGSCGALTSVMCSTDLNGTISSLTPGSTYYVRVFDGPGNQFAFDVLLKSVPSTPTNTTCGTASSLSNNYIQTTTLGLSNASLVPCGGGPSSPNKEMWFSFTATSAQHLIDFADMNRLSSNANALGYKVYSGACASLTEITCVNNVQYTNALTTGLTPSTKYYVQVLENTFNGGPVSYKIRSLAQAAPVNDESTGAITVFENPVCQNTAGSFKFSSVSANAATGTFSGDVWYKFVAATSDITIALTSTGTSYIQVYGSDASTVFYDPGFASNNVQLFGATVGQSYYVRIYNTGSISYASDADFSFCISGAPSSSAADVPTPSSCVIIDGPAISTNSGRWLHLTHQGKMVASVLDTCGSTGMGNIIGKYFINSGSVRSDAGGIEYLNRNFEITPTTQPSKPVAVRLYFTKPEFDALVQANDGDGNDVYYLNDLKISKFSSNPCASTLSLAGEVLYNINSYGTLASGVYYIEVIVPSFSSFFLKNVAGGVLPVNCVDFTAERKSNIVKLKWNTVTEHNADRYEIQRSIDGKDFIKIAIITAKGAGTYIFNDESLMQKAVYYYRLLAIDKDGSQRFACSTLKVASADTKIDIFGNIYPNPVKNELAIQIQKSYTGNVGLQVISSSGQILQQKSVALQPSDTKISLNTAELSTGVYILRLQTVQGIETIRFTKQ